MTPQDPAADTGAPGTEAGRVLLHHTAHHNIDCRVLDRVPRPCNCGLRDRILAIEAEVRLLRGERNHYLRGCHCPESPWCVPHGWAGVAEPDDHSICADHSHVAASQPSAAAAQGAGIDVERLRVAVTDALWPHLNDVVQTLHAGTIAADIAASYDRLAARPDPKHTHPFTGGFFGNCPACAARPDPDPAGAPFDAPATCARPGCGHDKGFHWGPSPSWSMTRGAGHGYCTSPGTSAAHCVEFLAAPVADERKDRGL